MDSHLELLMIYLYTNSASLSIITHIHGIFPTPSSSVADQQTDHLSIYYQFEINLCTFIRTINSFKQNQILSHPLICWV